MSRLFRALLAESLAIGLLAVLFGLPAGNVDPDQPAAETSATAGSPTHSPVQTVWRRTQPPSSNNPITSAAVQEQLGRAASTAGAVVQRELDRILAPFVAARSTVDQ